ncbi:3-hydroxybutyryl-CoA dehydrogenase [Leptospira kmetyi]|uniref:3-hydroxybutyryl-CoA dehydrogenase n=1 Tax=Leptospira kmetyi TaxID=408139 RepID=A0A5F1XJM9_9LEPT|nr:3-hydroxyacyl-CoA dehydrogenase NAD-binding domain-containing protein [Leptospira kmetyi]AYV57784.1 3-hydroxybutyryl-CoA dehydrogenase [Leptospira kmetyi]TGK12997.1 3-hydroxybutyryl-CoA dehydrogenase [Leptospira kmetyi]TGK34757.1 3-hydroxybutyryl-CoA dehydrogenase [Leptospira kmetyi]TGL69390.1 3-hydroxybutyryl-CoA dehydrogenase [Leptospira kmetyi]
MERIGVIGAGQMGSGISQTFAQAGYPIVLFDISEQQLEKALKGIEQNLLKLVKKGSISESEIRNTISRILVVQDLGAFKDNDVIIEAVSEDERLKIDLFVQLDQIAKKEAIIASNTSSISITRIASVTNRPEQIIGLHFMNPVPLMKLVEIIKGHNTSESTFKTAKNLVMNLGKEYCVSEDYPAFIVNRVLIPMINEAIFAVFEGVGKPEEIDKGMKLGTNQPMGPLALADFIGLDTCLAVMNVLFGGFKEPKYRPCPLLVKMVEAGHLGRKSGIGFYRYRDA